MSRSRKRQNGSESGGIFTIAAILAAIWMLSTPTGQRLLVVLVVIVISLVTLFFVVKFRIASQKREAERALQISDVDNMVGHRFEYYVASLLEHHGFQANVTKGSGDSGVDIVASKSGVKYAIQCKRSSSGISRRAVSDAVAGIAHYRCTVAMVVTNNYFTPGAESLAASNQCILIDRDLLATWIQNRQKGIISLPGFSNA